MHKHIATNTLVLAGASLALSSLASAQVRISAPIRVDAAPGGAVANELTQSATLSDPLVGTSGWNDYRNNIKSWFAVTRDGGNTWTEALVRPPAANQSSVEGDPHSAFDSRTGTLWAGGISFSGNGGVYAARLEPDKTTFEPTVMIHATGQADKGWMAAGVDPNNPAATRVYCSYNLGTKRSTDMGNTWSNVVSLGSGIGFLPKVGPNGELYVGYWDFGTKHLLRRSFDGGVTFGAAITIADRMDVWPVQDNPAIPGNFRVPSLQGLAVDPNSGVLYFVYFDTTSQSGTQRNVDVYFTKSTDQGATWATPIVINGDANFGDQFFPWVEVDETGRISVLYYDTRNTAQSDQSGVAIMDAYYNFSEDGGATWSEHRLTPTSFSSANDGFGSGFIGDYIGMSAGGGRVMPVYMATSAASAADATANVILHGPAQVICRGILCPCGNDDPTAGCGNAGIDNDTATGADMSASGSPSVAADDIVFTISGMKANQFAIIFVGAGLDSTPAGDGRRCIGGQLVRYPIRQSNAAGEFQLGPGEVVSIAQNFPAGFQPQPGDTWNYQTFYRDPTGPCGATFNTTNALSVTWEP